MAYPHIDFHDLIPLIRDRIGEKGTADGFWSDTSELLPVCKFICLDISKRIYYPYATIHGAISTNMMSITLPANFLCMDYKERSGQASVLFNIASTWIKGIPAKATMIPETSILTATGEATPSSIYWWQKTSVVDTGMYRRVLQLYPKITTGVNDPGYYINYVKIPTALTGNASSGTGNELTDIYFDEICDGAAWMLLLKQQSNLANYFWQKYNNALPNAALYEHERLQLEARDVPQKVKIIGG